MKWDNALKLSWKRFGITILSWILCVILHNAIYALFGFEEALFFIIAVIIIPIYIIVSLIYTIIKKIRSSNKNGKKR